MSTSMRLAFSESGMKAHFTVSHTLRAVKNIDMAYTSASTAEYHVESHHPKTRAAVMAVKKAPVAGDMPARRRLRRIHSVTMNTDMARKYPANAVNTPLERFTA